MKIQCICWFYSCEKGKNKQKETDRKEEGKTQKERERKNYMRKDKVEKHRNVESGEETGR
jgi:hypothetical protein